MCKKSGNFSHLKLQRTRSEAQDDFGTFRLRNQLEVMEGLLCEAINPNLQDRGTNGLHLAARAGHLPCVQMLIEAEAEIDQVQRNSGAPKRTRHTKQTFWIFWYDF
jgi:ankyrin repeat protein